SVVAAGGIYAVFLLAGTVSGLLSGHISDRIGFKPVLLFVFLLMPPALWLLLGVGGAWVYLGAVVAGGFVLAPLPLGVTMAQTLAPRGRSMVASLMMGFAYGLGGLTTPLIGKLADTYTIEPVLTAMAAIPLLAVAVITVLPRTKANG
ncbi:MFS transporter, partial [bacterium]|nr:MFS transporter [bacterium]